MSLAPPLSTLLVVGLAIGINVMYSLGRRYLTDVERTRRAMKELRAYHRELREAILKKDKAKEERLRKKKKQMDALQARVQLDNLKVTALFFIPLLAVYYGGLWLVGQGTVAIMPIPIPLPIIGTIGPELNFFWWYIISSIAMSGSITKLFGVGIE